MSQQTSQQTLTGIGRFKLGGFVHCSQFGVGKVEWLEAFKDRMTVRVQFEKHRKEFDQDGHWSDDPDIVIEPFDPVWVATNGNGDVMLDPTNGKTYRWEPLQKTDQCVDRPPVEGWHFQRTILRRV